MLSLDVNRVSGEADRGRESSREKNGPPNRSCEAGDDEDTAGDVQLCFGNGPIKEGNWRKEIAAERRSDLTRVTKGVSPRGRGQGVVTGRAGGWVTRPKRRQLTVDVVSEPINVERERMFFRQREHEGPAHRTERCAVRVGDEVARKRVAAGLDQIVTWDPRRV